MAQCQTIAPYYTQAILIVKRIFIFAVNYCHQTAFGGTVILVAVMAGGSYCEKSGYSASESKDFWACFTSFFLILLAALTIDREGMKCMALSLV